MAEKLLVRCPHCGKAYRVPPEGVGRKARCAQCGTKFVVELSSQPQEFPLTGEVFEEERGPSASGTFAGITPEDSFVAKALRGEEPDQPVTTIGPRPEISGPKPELVKPFPEPSVETPGATIILERIDDMGAYFEFPTPQLADANLRNAFPRRCVGCGAREDLKIHLLVFTDRLPARDALRSKELEVRDYGQLSD